MGNANISSTGNSNGIFFFRNQIYISDQYQASKSAALSKLLIIIFDQILSHLLFVIVLS